MEHLRERSLRLILCAATLAACAAQISSVKMLLEELRCNPPDNTAATAAQNDVYSVLPASGNGASCK
jgi:hypothetical protein